MESQHKLRASIKWSLTGIADEPEDFPVEIVKKILVCGIAAGTDPSSAVNTKSNAVRFGRRKKYTFFSTLRFDSDA